MRTILAFAAAAALILVAGCASGPTPNVNILQDEDPYADIKLGPISYTTPIGVSVPEGGTGHGWVKHYFTAHPEISGLVRFDGTPPASLKQDADRAVRAFLTRNGGGSVRSIQHSFRGTAEVLKYSTAHPAAKKGAGPKAGTLVILRQDGHTVQVSATGPRAMEYEVDSAAESLADRISFTPDGKPAREASPLARGKDDFRAKAAQEAAMGGR